MGKQTIFNKLRDNGLTAEGASALMGNMQAESGLKSNIAQRGLTSLSDEDYTSKADAGLIDFANDSVGYGLCQWTYKARKQALLNFAREYMTSVGDEEMQIDFCIHEFKTSYPALLAELKKSTDIEALTSKICTQYERPAVNNIATRVKFASALFEELKDTYPPVEENKNEKAIQLLEEALKLLRE